MMAFTMHVECHRAGQPRAYADSFYEYTMTFGPKFAPGEYEAKRYANAIRPFNEKKDRNHFDGRLDEWKQINKHTWQFLVVEPYTD